MNILKNIWGKIIYIVANFIDLLFNIFINITGFAIGLVIRIGRGAVTLISMGGCLFIMILGPALLLNPLTFFSMIFLIIFPILGTKFISYLKYIRYMTTEYLFDRSNNLINGVNTQFHTFNEYGNKYKKMEEEKIKREREKRQAEQQRQWEQRFRQWAEYESYQRNGTGQYNWGGQNTGAYVNPNIEFKSKYEKSCDLLGIPYNSDKYEIKLGYRKKAKEYHPDINKAMDATEKFQQINHAYEFLSDSNVERYKNIS